MSLEKLSAKYEVSEAFPATEAEEDHPGTPPVYSVRGDDFFLYVRGDDVEAIDALLDRDQRQAEAEAELETSRVDTPPSPPTNEELAERLDKLEKREQK